MINFIHNLTASAPIAAIDWGWFRPGASTVSDDVDSLFWFISLVNIFFGALILVLLVLFVVWYRRRPGHTRQPSPHHNNVLEATWSLIPLLIVVAIFFWGFTGYLDMRTPPDDAYEISVVAQKWNWSFEYGEFSSNELHVPVDRPVKLVMQSTDVLHSLYIPAFRVKMDCVPGKYTTMWFEATETSPGATADDPGGFELFCTEYCGTGHSSMMSRVVVHDSLESFRAWYEEMKDPRNFGNPVEVGEQLYTTKGCFQCHTLDGVDRPNGGGPSFKGYFGKQVAWANGESGEVDENYIRESILNPGAKIRAGYQNIMPSFQGRLKEDEIFALIQFIKSVNGAQAAEWAPRKGDEQTGDDEADEAADGIGEPEDEAASAEPTPEPTRDEANEPEMEEASTEKDDADGQSGDESDSESDEDAAENNNENVDDEPVVEEVPAEDARTEEAPVL